MSTDNFEILHKLWEANYDAFAEGRDMAPAEFADWVEKVRALLDPRESRFFNEPFEPEIQRIPELLRSKTGARLHKILMDRRVPKENGGLD